jgi:hypothetical protein
MLKLFGKWRSQGFRCVSYIDDGLFAASSREAAEGMLEVILQDLADHGLIVNVNKAHVVPAQAVRFLGFIIDSSAEVVRLYVPDDKLEKITQTVNKMLR